MKDKSVLLLALAVTAGCIIAGAFLLSWPAVPKTPRQPVKPATVAASGEASSRSEQLGASALPVAPASAVPQSPPPAAPAQAAVSRQTSPQLAPKPARSNPVQADRPPQDELARVALSFVGADPEAEAYWIQAINDSTLSADERQNLIEDLNEDGLPDPKYPSPTDLPLILNRIALIEGLAGGAMDKVNADAFAEVYKDLVNLANLATGGGEPVK